ncbi:hypothetical protein NL676_036732 [Syzygium grande]|nr:hypothetical protein NL676_036732 [Syzygium grande]
MLRAYIGISQTKTKSYIYEWPEIIPSNSLEVPIQVRHRTPPRGPTAGGAINATGAVDQFAWAGSSPLTAVVESTTSDRRLWQLVAHGGGVGVSGRRQQRRSVYVVP